LGTPYGGEVVIDTTPVVIDARHLAHLLAHTLHIHGLVPDPQQALSDGNLPALSVVVDGREFLITVEEQS